ncbi:06e19ba6-2275-446d-aaaa-21f6a3a84ba7 [Thermothielavioides terrestris]|uniref:06e19ba6-2275-446d-aaaa-21f6a3a84ba7 n=1 Tax=Thermothielavioides terrestris TaxID=2587410 RepID=A0A446BY41_9PEZI|nr:06e19ba6-2275-446d-aaaa-21f6a3a84ba7 [Thermothielavioides terrestris]
MAVLPAVLALLVPTSLAGSSKERMHDLGAAFRARYLGPSTHDGFVGIVGISPEDIDNSHFNIESFTDECSLASAVSFVQGLYPRSPGSPCEQNADPDYGPGEGSKLNDPLCDHQYPNIRTVHPDLDPDSIWSHGHENCRKRENSLLLFSNNSVAESIHQNTEEFYGSLWDAIFYEALPLSQANFYNAYDLYDYAAYRWNNDNRTALALNEGDLDELGQLAWQEQSLRHANVTGAGGAQDDDLTQAIAGRTLASRVTALFAENIESRGAQNKLNLAFTSHEPFLAFFALTGLSTGASSHQFSQLPSAGATLTFELFSVDDGNDTGETHQEHETTSSVGETSPKVNIEPTYRYNNGKRAAPPSKRTSSYDFTAGTYSQKAIDDSTMFLGYGTSSPDYGNQAADHVTTTPEYRNDGNGGDGGGGSSSSSSTAYPSIDQLHVRFLYRNSTDARGALVPYPLFGSDQAHMSFKHFNATMWSIGIANVTTWCSVCESNTFFCAAADPPPARGHHAWPAIVLGGAALAVVLFIILIVLILM